MRTLVDIPDDDLAIINSVIKVQSISRAEFIRRAIAQSLNFAGIGGGLGIEAGKEGSQHRT